MANILIVDDSAFARARLKRTLESGGHKIIGQEQDGKHAVQAYKELNPDIVTLDYLMSGKNGLEVLSDIIQIDSEAKVIIVSGSGDRLIEEKVFQSGGKGFVQKFNPQSSILAVISEMFDTQP
jgi:two-component system chemotaxis response regulator CheY